MQLEFPDRVIDGSALARNRSKRLTRVPEGATPTQPDRAIETARRTVISQAAARSRANRVQDGQSLGALQATAGPPAGALSTSSLLATNDDSRRRTSLFDLPKSGGAVIERLRAQVRPSSPLNGLLGGDDGPGVLSRFIGIDKSDPLSALNSGALNSGALPSGGLNRTGLSRRSSLAAAQSIASELRSSFSHIDNDSRSLMQLNNPLRASGGFSLRLPTSSFNLLG